MWPCAARSHQTRSIHLQRLPDSSLERGLYRRVPFCLLQLVYRVYCLMFHLRGEGTVVGSHTLRPSCTLSVKGQKIRNIAEPSEPLSEPMLARVASTSHAFLVSPRWVPSHLKDRSAIGPRICRLPQIAKEASFLHGLVEVATGKFDVPRNPAAVSPGSGASG